MPRKPVFPRYPEKPHASGQARISIRGRHHYLGLHGTPESMAEYARLYADWQANGPPAKREAEPGQVRTVNDVIARWGDYAVRRRYKEEDGEAGNFTSSLRPLVRLHGPTLLEQFGAPQLRRVLEAMADGSWMIAEDLAAAARRGRTAAGWCRRVCNRALGRIKLVFRVAEREGWVPRGTAYHLSTVEGLEVDECGVRESDDVAPVAEADLQATLPHLNHVVRALVELLLLTGARPKELRLLRPRDIDQSGRLELAKGYWVDLGADVWAVKLERHKTARKKIKRLILFGPKAQAVLRPFLVDRDPDACLFSPAEAVAERNKVRRAARKSKVPPSQRDRRKADPKRKPSNHYTRRALDRSIAYAIRQARKSGAAVQGFSPYQLRHLAATRLVEEFGEDVARIILGHAHVSMTRHYALSDFRKAAAAQDRAG